MLDLKAPTAHEAKDLACADAHEALRAALLAPLLKRPDAAAIFARVHAGDELRLELDQSGAYCATLIGSTVQRVADGHLMPGPAAADLFVTLVDAANASLRAESPERLAELNALLPGLPVVYMLRLNLGSEVFVIRAGHAGPPAFIVQRAVEVDRAAALH